MGEGSFRKSIGNPLIIISAHNTSCKLCKPFQNKVLIDDVYSGGTQEDGDYMLLSEAMERGLYHPRCKHGCGTYYPEIEHINQYETPENKLNEYGDKAVNAAHIDNMIQRYKRLVTGSIDKNNIEKYQNQLQLWEQEREKTLENIDNSAENGIIEPKMTKINSAGDIVSPMDSALYFKIKEKLEKQGYTVIAAQGEDERYLKYIGAEALADSCGIIHLGKIPSASAFFEEIIHLTQIKKYGSLNGSDFVERAAREVAANRMLLKHGKKYGFSTDDFSEIKSNLEYWEKDYLKKVGVSYDEGNIFREI